MTGVFRHLGSGIGALAVSALACQHAPRPAPAAAACPAGATCFDFEDGTVGQPPGAPFTAPTDGTVLVDAHHAASGTRGIRVAGRPHKDSVAYLSLRGPFFPTPANDYYGRVMMWAGGISSGHNHWTILKSSGTVPGKGWTAEYTYGAEGPTLIANYDTIGARSDCWQTGGKMIVERWVCLEWHFEGATNEVELWYDGVPTARVSGRAPAPAGGCIAHETDDVWLAPRFEGLDLGYEMFANETRPPELWYDDLALSTRGRIGCPRP